MSREKQGMGAKRNEVERDFFTATDLVERSEVFEELDRVIRYSGRAERRLWAGLGLLVLLLVSAVAAFGPKKPTDGQPVARVKAPLPDPPVAAERPTPVSVTAEASAVEAATTSRTSKSRPVSMRQRPQPEASPRAAFDRPLRAAPAVAATPKPEPVAVAVAPEPAEARAEPLPSPRLRAMLNRFGEAKAAPADPAALDAAREAIERERFEQAVELLADAERSPAVHALLGRAWYEMGEDAKALAALEAARAGRPDDAETLLLLGSLLQSTQPEKARGAYRAFLAARPEGPQAEEVRAILDRI